MVHANKPSTQKAVAGELLRLWGQAGLYNESRVCPCLKTNVSTQRFLTVAVNKKKKEEAVLSSHPQLKSLRG